MSLLDNPAETIYVSGSIFDTETVIAVSDEILSNVLSVNGQAGHVIIDTGKFITGVDLSSYATIANLALTGNNLQNQINNLDLDYASQNEINTLSGNLSITGSNLQSQINNLYSSGFITGVNLTPYVTKVSGEFFDRPTVNGTGVLLSGEAAGTTEAISGMVGAASGTDGQAGLVPKPVAGDNRYFLRGDGAWSDPTISKIQYIENSNNITLDVANYSTFVVNLTESATFTYSGFENGKSINIYLVANHAGHLPHTFPHNTVFAELGDDNVIYSFQDYTTRILLQDIGNYVYNFSSVVRTPINPYYYYNNPIAGIGIDLLDLYLNII